MRNKRTKGKRIRNRKTGLKRILLLMLAMTDWAAEH
jgi:hypothetical protein